jgi:prevent-host-death family protein
MNFVEDIQTLSEFKKNASKLIKQVRETKRPLVLTVNGKPAVVIHDPAMYQSIVKDQEYWETVTALKEGLQDIDNHKNWPTQQEAFESIRAKIKEKYS